MTRADRQTNGPLSPAVRALSFHSEYRCGNSGVCCRTDWPIAVEVPVELRLRRDLPGNELPNGPDGFLPAHDGPEGCRSVLRTASTGACWFRDEPGRRCSVHAALGQDALPSACRQFPRVAVID